MNSTVDLKRMKNVLEGFDTLSAFEQHYFTRILHVFSYIIKFKGSAGTKIGRACRAKVLLST